jgi:chorismate synthase
VDGPGLGIEQVFENTPAGLGIEQVFENTPAGLGIEQVFENAPAGLAIGGSAAAATPPGTRVRRRRTSGP